MGSIAYVTTVNPSTSNRDTFDIIDCDEEEEEFREAPSLNALVLFVVNYIISRHIILSHA